MATMTGTARYDLLMREELRRRRCLVDKSALPEIKPKKTPVTTCKLIDTPNRRVVDLSCEGIPEIPVLGMNRSVQTTEGPFFHRHASLEITYCDRGSVKFDCGGHVYSIMPGSVFISRPEDVHRLRMNPKGSRLYWIFLKLPRRGEPLLGLDLAETKWLVQALKSLPRKAFAAPTTVGACYERLFEVLDDEEARSVSRRLKLRAAAVQLLIALAEAGASATEADEDVRFRALVDKMRREPTKAFSMAEVTQALGCSPNTVRTRFRKYTGLSPQSFMMKCRIRKAEDLIRKGKLSVTDIAYELGFSSSQNFAIRFRQETGRSPTEWRKLHALTPNDDALEE